MDTRAWADAVIKGSRKGGKDDVTVDFRFGVIVSAVGQIATVRMSGGTETMAGVRAADHVTASVNQLCLVMERGTQRFIIATVTP